MQYVCLLPFYGLLKCGFKQSKTEPEHYTLEYIKLKDAAKRLGFSLNQLGSITNRPADHDYRKTVVRDYNVIITSNGRSGLDNPETFCSVHLWLIPQWQTNFGNGEMLFTTTGTGDVVQFILGRALALGARPLVTNDLLSVRDNWRCYGDHNFLRLRVPSARFAEMESFLTAAFGPLFLLPKSGGRVFYSQTPSITSIWVSLYNNPEFTEVNISRLGHKRTLMEAGAMQPFPGESF